MEVSKMKTDHERDMKKLSDKNMFLLKEKEAALTRAHESALHHKKTLDDSVNKSKLLEEEVKSLQYQLQSLLRLEL